MKYNHTIQISGSGKEKIEIIKKLNEVTLFELGKKLSNFKLLEHNSLVTSTENILSITRFTADDLITTSFLKLLSDKDHRLYIEYVFDNVLTANQLGESDYKVGAIIYEEGEELQNDGFENTTVQGVENFKNAY